MKKKLSLASMLLAVAQIFANDSTRIHNDTLIKRAFQVSFIGWMGTNGMEANKCENKFSLNIFAGHQGGLNGIELAGFVNSIRTNAKGVQGAGFVNSVVKKMNGAQLAGFTNYAGQLNGIQGSGFINVVKDSSQGAQGAGFLNYAGKGMEGGQFAGLSNIASGEVKGIQISGLFNFAKILKGTQIGFINYSDSIVKGTMIGFFSYSPKGYHTLELESNEFFYGNLNFKTGTRKFYNIIGAGLRVRNNTLFYGFGYGLGGMVDFNKKLALNMELMSYHINKDEWFTKKTNTLNKLKINLSYQAHPHFTIYAGPSLNVLVTEIDNNGESLQNKGFSGTTFYEKTFRDKSIKMYLGVQAGIRF